MTDYHSPQGCEGTRKPLAYYRDQLRNGVPPVEARMDLYLELQWKWGRMRRRPDLFRRHQHQIINIAYREAAHIRDRQEAA